MILLTGASGFVGRQILEKLLQSGRKVRALVRRKESLHRWESLEIAEGDVTRPATLKDAMRGVKAVIHLVGIIVEREDATFRKIHVEGTINILTAAKEAGVKRFIHMSAAGTREHAVSEYHRTKWEAEELVRQSGLDWTIFRPSLIYGSDGELTRLLFSLNIFPLKILLLDTIPCIGGGITIFRPIPVGDVATAFVRSVGNGSTVSQTFELGGPKTTFREILETVAKTAGRKPTFINNQPATLLLAFPWYFCTKSHPLILPVPFALARFGTAILERGYGTLRLFLPHGIKCRLPPLPLSMNILAMLEENHLADTTSAENILDIHPPAFADGITHFQK